MQDADRHKNIAKSCSASPACSLGGSAVGRQPSFGSTFSSVTDFGAGGADKGVLVYFARDRASIVPVFFVSDTGYHTLTLRRLLFYTLIIW